MSARALLVVRARALLVVLAVLAPIAAAAATAEGYTARPLRLIVPTAPGGSTDIVARIAGAYLAERFGAQVVIDNRPGAGGAIGVDAAVRAPADGQTLLLVSGSQMTLPVLRTLPYDLAKAFAPIAKLASVHLALVVHSGLEVNSLQDLIVAAKRKPGAINFSGAGPGAHVTMATELFKSMARIDVVIVEYKSGGPAVIGLLGGETQAMLATIPSVLPHVKAHKLRVLATSGPSRSHMLPDAPTIAQSGVPGYAMVQWHGIVAPTGTPQRKIEHLHAELKAMVGSDDGARKLVAAGTDLDFLGLAEFGSFMRREMDLWAQLIRDLKPRP
ncbi:MAG: tripartite tricarboxylate transporter substrate binding protein [Burkholderiales bacterium]|nr:tripartite tricarboxylate transporter substrate binding protein [Burkholderiales bacterium]